MMPGETTVTLNEETVRAALEYYLCQLVFKDQVRVKSWTKDGYSSAINVVVVAAETDETDGREDA